MVLSEPLKAVKDFGWKITLILLLVGQHYYLVCVFLIFFASFILDFFTKDLIVADDAVSSKGYVTFSLTNGPEYHISQVCFITTLKWCSLDVLLSSSSSCLCG